VFIFLNAKRAYNAATTESPGAFLPNLFVGGAFMINVAQLTRNSRLVLIALLAAFALPAAHAQQTVPTTLPTTPSHTGVDAAGFGDTNPRDPDQMRMMKDMSRERNSIRQKQIVDDTAQLLDLAKQLKDAVDKSSKDQLSLSVVNTATEIEKLAKAVKEKMRDGQ
jgi:hypothetical protein